MSLTSERIKSCRQQKKLTQQGLAELINSSRGSVAKIETDVFTPSFAMLSLIADALDTTVEYLQGTTDTPLKSSLTPSDNGDENAKRVDLSDDDLIMSFEGKELSEDYKQAILAMLKTLREDKK